MWLSFELGEGVKRGSRDWEVIFKKWHCFGGLFV